MSQSQERFNGVTTMKAKTLTKIMSSVLCAALTMQIGWSLKYEKINAYHGLLSWEDSTDGSIVSISSSDDTYTSFTFIADNNGGINIS